MCVTCFTDDALLFMDLKANHRNKKINEGYRNIGVVGKRNNKGWKKFLKSPKFTIHFPFSSESPLSYSYQL